MSSSSSLQPHQSPTALGATPSSASLGEAGRADGGTSVGELGGVAGGNLSAVVGSCHLHINDNVVDFAPPAYLFPEVASSSSVATGTPAGGSRKTSAGPPLNAKDPCTTVLDVPPSRWVLSDFYLQDNLNFPQQTSTTSSSDGLASGTNSKQLREISGAGTASVELMRLIEQRKLPFIADSMSHSECMQFSSADVVEQLVTLAKSQKLSEDLTKQLLSNHFLNFLAWQRLKELNTTAEIQQSSITGGNESAAVVDRSGLMSDLDGVARSVFEELPEYLPSKDPYSSEAEASGEGHAASAGDKKTAGGGKQKKSKPNQSNATTTTGSVSAHDATAHNRNQLFSTLTTLVGRTWATQVSQACQTVPATHITAHYPVNTTLPVLHPPEAHEIVPLRQNGGEDKPTSSSDGDEWFAVISSLELDTDEGGEDEEHSLLSNGAALHGGALAVKKTVPLTPGVNGFGRPAGIGSNSAIGSGSVFDLSPCARHAKKLSPLHFQLHLVTKSASPATEAGEVLPQLTLVNYSKNGVKVRGKKWVLGETAVVEEGDTLVVAGEVCVTVVRRAKNGDDAAAGVAAAGGGE